MSPKERWEALKELGKFEFKDLNIAWEHDLLFKLFKEFKPEAILNLAQQPSAAYSMISPWTANFTIRNNVQGLLNVLWAMRDHAPQSSLVTLGTLGEYGFPNMNIPEGFFEVEHEGMQDILPFPRQAQSIYHVSKVMKSDLAWMATRVWELRATDIHQGVIYGTRTEDICCPEYYTRFDVGECFGTMLNRAVACVIIGHPIIPYGSGMQKRGYIALQDAVKCSTLALENHPTDNDSIHGYRVINQFDECYTCNELAEIVQKVANEKFGLNATIKHVPNPRVEPEVHYYNPKHEKLRKMGWKPTRMLEEELEVMFDDLMPHRKRMEKYKSKIVPIIRWRPKK